jgi:hypothetical protein
MLTGKQLQKFGSSTLLLYTGSSNSTVHCWTLKMKTAHSSTMPVFVHQSTHISEGLVLQINVSFVQEKQDREQKNVLQHSRCINLTTFSALSARQVFAKLLEYCTFTFLEMPYHIVSYHIVLYHYIVPYRIIFIFIPWIRTGLQNAYGYGNSEICLINLDVKSIQKCTKILVTGSSGVLEVLT